MAENLPKYVGSLPHAYVLLCLIIVQLLEHVCGDPILNFYVHKCQNLKCHTHVINHYVYQQQFHKRGIYRTFFSKYVTVSASVVKESYGWSVKSFDPTGCIAILVSLFIRVLFVTPMQNQSCQFTERLHNPEKIAKHAPTTSISSVTTKKQAIRHRSKTHIISLHPHHPYFINTIYCVCKWANEMDTSADNRHAHSLFTRWPRVQIRYTTHSFFLRKILTYGNRQQLFNTF